MDWVHRGLVAYSKAASEYYQILPAEYGNDGEDQRSRVISELWNGLLYPLPQLLKVDPEEHDCIEEVLEELILQNIRHHLNDKYSFNQNTPTALIMEVFDGEFDKRSSNNRLIYTIDSDKPVFNKKQPVSVIRYGQWLLETAIFTSDPILIVARGLALIGAGKMQLRPSRMCPFCFRYALPNHTYCIEHRIDTRDGEKTWDGASRRNHKRGRVTSEKVSHERQSVIEIEYADSLTDILFPSSDQMYKEMWDALEKSLPDYPIVYSLVERQSHVNICERLRLSLDSSDYLINPVHWKNKITEAEKWLSAERDPLKSRGLGKKTDQRIKTIALMISQKHPVKHIAESIGLTKDAIYKVMKRHPESFPRL